VLTAARDEVVLLVIDEGVGFEPSGANGKAGLGLVSMRERARLVDGHVTVSSRPGGGTRIEVHVPVGMAS
jgi:signal transduction histidine kinase